MKHRNAPKGGSGTDPEIAEGLEEYQTEKHHEAVNRLFEAAGEELTSAALVRFVCVGCGNFLREREVRGISKDHTLKAVGTCCKHIVPEHIQNKCMPVEDEDSPQPQRHDQRREPRQENPS